MKRFLCMLFMIGVAFYALAAPLYVTGKWKIQFAYLEADVIIYLLNTDRYFLEIEPDVFNEYRFSQVDNMIMLQNFLGEDLIFRIAFQDFDHFTLFFNDQTMDTFGITEIVNLFDSDNELGKEFNEQFNIGLRNLLMNIPIGEATRITIESE